MRVGVIGGMATASYPEPPKLPTPRLDAATNIETLVIRDGTNELPTDEAEALRSDREQLATSRLADRPTATWSLQHRRPKYRTITTLTDLLLLLAGADVACGGADQAGCSSRGC